MARICRATLIGAAITFAAGAHAQVYKCVDPSGKTVYSQAPCPSGDKSRTIRRDAPPPAPAAATKSPAELEMDYRKRQIEKEKSEKAAAEKANEASQRQQNCELSRQSVAQYETGARVARIDSKGERYYLSDDEIAKERVRAQALVDQWCK